MLKLTVVVGMLLAMVVPVHASLMFYTFTGTDQGIPTLAGSLTLDASTPFVVDAHDFGPPLGVLLSGTLTSPLNTISGTFNGITFTGTPLLSILNFPIDSDTSTGDWIIRANLTSADGSFVHINLFQNLGPGGIVAISLIPPTPPPCCNFSAYQIELADGRVEGGLLSLAVPEPTTALLTGAGVILLLAGYQRIRRLTRAANFVSVEM